MNYWLEFFILALAHLAAVASPGADFAIVTKNTVKFGKRIGRITALGVGTAILLHVSYAILGFSILVETTPWLYQTILWIGAAFLFYLGIQSLTANMIVASDDKFNLPKKISDKKAFLLGFFTNALNVKAILFFLFLFTSVVSETTPMLYKILYGLWLAVMTFVWFYFIATVFGKEKVQQFFQKFSNLFDKIMGLILIGLAILLILK